MNPELLFDFTVDHTTATIYVTREFDADIVLVWDAWTKAEMLDQWMGPKPWRVQTKEMDFREGGRWLYAMISPEQVHHWSLAEFIKIQPRTSFTTKNSFSDEHGNPVNTGFTFSITTNSFKPEGERTIVQVAKKMANLSELERFIAGGGFKEGSIIIMRNLDDYLQTLRKK